MTHRTTAKRFGAGLALALATAAALPLAGCPSGGGGGAKGGAREIDKVPEGAVDAKVDRFRVPLGTAPIKGAANAKVTIIEWSDFQCPFCSRVGATMEQIEKAYGKDVRVAFKHNPLPFHQNAMPAAQAAIAAQKQGDDKFWKMHDTLFKNQQALDADSLVKYAGELQLNLNFSHKFGVADFFYDDDGVRCSLSFQGQPFFCDIPWTAVWGLTSHADGERVLWPDSLPAELKSLLPAQARHPAGKDDDGDDPPPSPKPTLRRIK